MKRRNLKSKIVALLRRGVSGKVITEKLGCSKAAVSYHKKKLGLSSLRVPTLMRDWTKIQQFYDGEHTVKQCMERYNFSMQEWINAKRRGDICARSQLVPFAAVLVRGSTYHRGSLKKQLVRRKLLKEVCAVCGLAPVWEGERLTLVLDHINGVNDDNRLENLRFLCPNCNSQTDTFAGRNCRRQQR